jgi:DHA1 family bicyclomycin/chloramphenicol resistance-like MFS transporter
MMPKRLMTWALAIILLFGVFPVLSLLLAALFVYAAAGIVAAVAPNLTVLAAARVAQAIGGCGGLVLGRAVVRDSAGDGGQAASRMALLTTTQSLAPGIAPALGGYLGAWFGWRSVFVLLVAIGLFTLIAALLSLPETAASRGSATGRMLPSYARLMRMPAFRGFMIGGTFNSTSIYAYLAASPFIFTEILHRPAEEAGLFYLAVMAGVPFGSFGASRFARRFALPTMLRVSSGVAIAGAAALFLFTVTGHLSVGAILGSMLVYSIGIGATSPIALTAAMGVAPQMIGAASGLYGFVQMAFGAFCTLLVGLIPGGPAFAAAAILIVATVAGQFALASAARRGIPD